MASRDFYQHIWLNIEDNGTVKCITHEIDMPHDPNGKVRMRLPMGCLACSPDPDKPGGSIIKSVIEGDLQGNIPQWVWALGIMQAANSFVQLRHLIPQYIEQNPEVLTTPPIEQQKHLYN